MDTSKMIELIEREMVHANNCIAYNCPPNIPKCTCYVKEMTDTLRSREIVRAAETKIIRSML